MSLLTREEIAAIAGEDESIYSGMVDFGFAVEEAVIAKLATVSVEPVAWMCPDDPERETAFTWHQAKCQSNGCGKHRVPVYQAEALAAARVQALGDAATAFEAEADTWKAWPQAGAAKRKGAEAIRALIG